MRKILALILVPVLMFSAFPLCFAEEAEDPGTALCQTIKTTYKKARSLSGKSSLSGFCGRATVCQLWALGIDNTGIARDGNKNFPYYRDLHVTDSGYFTRAYSAREYSLTEALNAVTDYGRQDAGVLMVGFSSTNSAAGAVSGHSCVIYGILDGMVYFAESSLHDTFDEGTPIVKSIDEFAEDYNSWAVFQGLIEFIPGDTLLEQQSTRLYVQSTAACSLISLNGGNTLRTVLPGENLQVVGINGNTYRVNDGLLTGYVDGANLKFLFWDFSDVGAAIINCPAYLSKDENLNLTGSVYTDGGRLELVCIRVYEKKAGCVLRRRICPDSNRLNLADYGLRKELNRLMYKTGTYTITVQALVSHCCLYNGEVRTVTQCENLWETTVCAGTRVSRSKTAQAQTVYSGGGWQLKDGNWTYTDSAEPLNGWKTVGGTDYYFKNSCALTGRQTIDGVLHCFTSTGALRTGWVPHMGSYYYMDESGYPVTGLQSIDGQVYRFDDSGLMCRNCWYEDGENRYYYGSDGLPVSGWQKIGEDAYLFARDGCCLASLVTVQQREKQTGSRSAKKVRKTYVRAVAGQSLITAAGLLSRED